MTTVLKIVAKDETVAQLKKLQDNLDAPSLSDVIRRAVELYEYLLTSTDDGSKLILRYKYQEKEVIS